MTDPRVSVIVRTKDRPEFLKRALRSIADQTLADWECVIVNDGGAPAAVDALVERLPDQHRTRVRVLHRERAHGRWISANAGVLASTAPLIVLHDDDDTWHPEFLERACDYLDDPRNRNRGGVVSRIEIVWEQREGDRYREVEREMFQPQLTAPTLGDTLLFNRFVPIGFVYRRRLHEELGLYDERLPVVGDWNFNLKVLTRGPLDYLHPVTPYAYWHQRRGEAGAEGNSVIAAGAQHRRYDAMLRDEALREYVGEHGIGLALYLTKFIDQRFVDVENGIRDEIARSSMLARAYRKARRTLRGD
jgi:glycosyltransferase involved in cell wall biosynthesis